MSYGGNGRGGSPQQQNSSVLPRPPSLRKQLSPLHHSREDGGSSSPVMMTPVLEAPFDEPMTPLPPMAPSLQPLPEDREMQEEEELEPEPEQATSSAFDNVPPRPSREYAFSS